MAAQRGNQYSGKPEYKLEDHVRNRIDYTRWFEEACLHPHDASVPDQTCRRLAKNGRLCTSTPLHPSGLCIKHKILFQHNDTLIITHKKVCSVIIYMYFD